MDWVLPKIIGSGRVSGTRLTLNHESLTYVEIDGTALLLRMASSSSGFVFHQRKLLCVLVIVHLQNIFFTLFTVVILIFFQGYLGLYINID